MITKTAFIRFNERIDEIESVSPSWSKNLANIILILLLAREVFELITRGFNVGSAAVATAIAGTLLFELWRTLVWKRRKVQL